MTENEKMLNGSLYNPFDKELFDKRVKARNLSSEFNLTKEEENEKRFKILESLLGKMGENCEFHPSIRFDYGENTFIGDNCFFNYNSVFLDCGKITIGNNVFVGPNVSFLTPVHPMLSYQRNIQKDENGNLYNLEYASPISIEDNVWIGGSVTINGGVTIGHDSVIGSSSVVTKDIPSGVFAAGNPCRVIRKITENDKLWFLLICSFLI